MRLALCCVHVQAQLRQGLEDGSNCQHWLATRALKRHQAACSLHLRCPAGAQRRLSASQHRQPRWAMLQLHKLPVHGWMEPCSPRHQQHTTWGSRSTPQHTSMQLAMLTRSTRLSTMTWPELRSPRHHQPAHHSACQGDTQPRGTSAPQVAGCSDPCPCLRACSQAARACRPRAGWSRAAPGTSWHATRWQPRPPQTLGVGPRR